MPHIAAKPYATDDVLNNNFQNLKDHIHDADFNIWIGPISFFASTGGTAGGITNSAYWLMADAGLTRLGSQHYLPSYWNKGKVSAKLFYTGLNSSTNNIIFTLTLGGWKESTSSLNGGSADVSATDTITTPGPATAYYLKTVVMSEANWLAINSDYPYMSIKLARDGTTAGDTYGNDVLFLGALLTFHPTRR